MCIFVYKLFAYSLYSIDLSPAGIIFFNQAWVFYDIQTSSNTQQTMFKIIWPICACWNSKKIVCAVWNTVQEKLLFYIPVCLYKKNYKIHIFCLIYKVWLITYCTFQLLVECFHSCCWRFFQKTSLLCKFKFFLQLDKLFFLNCDIYYYNLYIILLIYIFG